MTLEEYKAKHEVIRKEKNELLDAYHEARNEYRKKLKEEKELQTALAEELLGVKVGENAILKELKDGNVVKIVVNIDDIEAYVYKTKDEENHISISLDAHRLKKDGTPSNSNADKIHAYFDYGQTEFPHAFYARYLFVGKAE